MNFKAARFVHLVAMDCQGLQGCSAAPVVTPDLARASLPPAAKSNSVLTINDRGLAVNGLVNVFWGESGLDGGL